MLVGGGVAISGLDLLEVVLHVINRKLGVWIRGAIARPPAECRPGRLRRVDIRWLHSCSRQKSLAYSKSVGWIPSSSTAIRSVNRVDGKTASRKTREPSLAAI